jgi:high-affinity iron transporter
LLRLGLILLALGTAPSRVLGQEPIVSAAEAAAVETALATVEDALRAGDAAVSERRALDAYLVFEEVEPRIAAIDPGLVVTLESAYGAVRTRAAAGDLAGASAELDRVRALLADATRGQAALGTRSAFLNSFGILFREGIEALLICAALAAATARRGSGLARAILQGAAAALAASVLTAVVVDRVIDLAPAGREAIEGVTMLLATAVLFYVSYWLLSKVEVARWMTFLRDRVGRAESRWALFGVAFLAVYREGAETILFYQALAGAGRPAPIAAGFLAAAIVLLVIAVAVFKFGVRLPTRPLFAVTGALLYYLAFVFAGQGVHELQEAGWVALTPMVGVPEIGWLGLYPSVQTVAVQSLLVGLALVAGGVILRRARLARAAVARPSGAL